MTKMPKLRAALNLTLFFFIACLMFQACSKRSESTNSSSFDFVFEWDDVNYIYKSVTIGQNVFLLGDDKTPICEGLAGQAVKIKGEATADFFATKLVLDDCDPALDYSLAVFPAGGKNVEHIKPKPISQKEIIDKLDEKVRSSNIKEKCLKYPDFGYKGEQNFSLSSDSPVASRLSISNLNVIILTYKIVDPRYRTDELKDSTGPRFIFINGSLYPLAGPFSFKELIPFTVDDHLYISTGVGCFDCGAALGWVFRITPNGPELEMERRLGD